MTRYKLTLDYDGTPFGGWQRQANAPSVQQAIEDAVFAVTGEVAMVNGAGRTDAGVHACGQVAHLDLAHWTRGAFVLSEALNAHLVPQPIGVLEAEVVSADFDARFSAIRRHYRYLVHNRRAPLTLTNARAHQIKPPLDVAAMYTAARCLIGRHDFSTFRDAECQAKSPIRTLERCDVSVEDNDTGAMIAFHLSARSFLHRQVRSLVGSLLQVGLGRWQAKDLQAALEARDRSRCGPVAPACGLYLMRVEYGEA